MTLDCWWNAGTVNELYGRQRYGFTPVRLFARWHERLRGLLGTKPDYVPVVLTNCKSIHTFGMRYALDIAFVNAEGIVVKVVRGLVPNRLSFCPSATYVFERAACDREWLEKDDCLGVVIGVERGVA